MDGRNSELIEIIQYHSPSSTSLYADHIEHTSTPLKNKTFKSMSNFTSFSNFQSPIDKTWVYSALAEHPVVKSFLVGAVSGTCSTILFQPFDLLKTRLQKYHTSANNQIGTASAHASRPRMFALAIEAIREDRIIGLWRGTLPSLIRCVPGVGLYFSSLHYLKDNLFKSAEGPTPFEAIYIGVFARSMATSLLIPVTVIKTRYESGLFDYRSVSNAIRGTYATEGFRGLSLGLLPTILRDAPFSGLYYMFFTQLKSQVESYQKSQNLTTKATPALTFLCGLSAGLMASVITHPADVIKTKMQLYPTKCPNFRTTFLHVFKHYGVEGFARGLVPRMIRRTLMAAMAWTVYESLIKSIGLK